MPTQTPEQRAAAFSAAGLNNTQQNNVNAGIPSAINVSNLQTPVAPFNIANFTPPPVPTVPSPAPQNPEGDALGGLETALTEQFDPEKKLESSTAAAQAPIQSKISALDARIQGFDAAALKRQEAALNSGDTLAYATGLSGQVARTDAIERLTLLAERSALTGDLEGAQRNAKLAVDAEYAVQQKRLETLRQNITNNYDDYSNDQKKRADALLLKLDKDDAFVAQAKADRLERSKLQLTARQFGADDKTIKAIQDADTLDDAILVAGQSLTDPKAKYELETARYNSLKAKYDFENRGQLTPEQKEKAQVKQTQIKAANTRAKEVLAVVAELKANSFAKNSVTGLRGPGAILGRPGTKDFLDKTKRLQSILAIDSIKDLKGTGPISDREFGTAASAASSITIDEENGKISGSTAHFNAELVRIENAMQAALIETVELDDEEDDMIEEIGNMPALEGPIDPFAYYFRPPTI